jgi:hypothetical protein
MRRPFQHDDDDDEMKAKVCLWVLVLRTFFFMAGIKLAHSRTE